MRTPLVVPLAPHALEQLLAGVRTTRMGRHERQQAELLRPEMDGQRIAPDLVRDQVELDAVRDRQRGAGHGTFPAPAPRATRGAPASSTVVVVVGRARRRSPGRGQRCGRRRRPEAQGGGRGAGVDGVVRTPRDPGPRQSPGGWQTTTILGRSASRMSRKRRGSAVTRTVTALATLGRSAAVPPLASTSQATRPASAGRAVGAGLGSGLDGGMATTSWSIDVARQRAVGRRVNVLSTRGASQHARAGCGRLSPATVPREGARSQPGGT